MYTLYAVQLPRATYMAKNDQRKLFCDVESEIIDPETGRVVGLVYRWNTGERRKHWHSRPYKIFKLRLVDPQAGQHHDAD